MCNLRIVALGAALGGCASSAVDIAPVRLAGGLSELHLQQLALEAQSVLCSRQPTHKRRRRYCAAIVIFWPAVFFVVCDNQTAAELSQMKGQMVAVEQASIVKKCNIQFQGSARGQLR